FENFLHCEIPSFHRIFPTHHFDDTATKLDMAVSTLQQLENLERRLNIAVKFTRIPSPLKTLWLLTT
uniref:KxDL domain-containing protein n=1 Tax=Mesocestoides corti TaxID=53468 RepID=A0A5K3FZN5_MESCO